MHHLDRERTEPPEFLAQMDWRKVRWRDLFQDRKRAIRQALDRMQGPPKEEVGPIRCAYCESALGEEKHIEHFRRKDVEDGYPELTYAWENLFLSCGKEQPWPRCGHFKDSIEAPPYHPDELIKPDEEDPERFLAFHADGRVRPRAHLSPKDRHRADKTIEVFHLNERTVVIMRRQILEEVQEEAEALIAFAEAKTQEGGSFPLEARLRELVQAYAFQPYSTAVRHLLVQTPTPLD